MVLVASRALGSTLYYPLYLEVRLPRYLRGDDAVQWRVSRHLIMFPAVSHLTGPKGYYPSLARAVPGTAPHAYPRLARS